MLEKQIEAKLVKGIEEMGGIAYKFVSPGNVGVPDRLIVLPGGCVQFVELKTDTGQLSAIQYEQMIRLRLRGAHVWVLHGLPEVQTFLAACREYVGHGGEFL